MIIGIGGVSRSGKTFLSHEIVWHYRQQNLRAIALRIDDYVRPILEIPMIQRVTDWETPASINYDLVLKSLHFFEEHFDVVVIEGHLAFSNGTLLAMMDKKISLKLSKEMFYKRKENDTRWGEVDNWYVEHIWESYERYKMPAPDYFVVEQDYPHISHVKEYLSN